jgi:thioredoxin reductase (NADPH)
MTIYPNAKRVLLTAYADTEAAIRAINSAKIHYYLNKPWDPPEEKLYPVLDDLLETWKQGYKPPFEGIASSARAGPPADHNVRDFLSRNRIPYKWLNPEQHPEAVDLLKERGIDDSKLPVILFGDGTALVQPTTSDLATKLASAPRPSRSSTTSSSSAPALLASPRASTQPRKVSHPHRRGRRSRRPGRFQLQDRKLPRLPPGSQSGEELAKRAFLQANRLGAEFLTQRVTCIRSRKPIPHRPVVRRTGE